MKKTGGPAFPRPAGHNGLKGIDEHRGSEEQDGMTLRDYFAGQAMLAAVSETQEVIPASFWDFLKHTAHQYGVSFLYARYRVVEGAHQEAARRAYAYADAMLAERGRGG